MHALGHLARSAHKLHRVIRGIRAVRHAVLFDRVIHKGNARDNEAGAAAGARRIVVDTTLVKASLLIAEAERSHWCHGKTVFNAYFANGKWCEQNVFRTHACPPLSSVDTASLTCQYLHVNQNMIYWSNRQNSAGHFEKNVLCYF